MSSQLREQFEEQGFIGPVRVLTKNECEEAHRRVRIRPQPMVWFKGNAASCWSYYQLASRDDILDLVRSLLGPDVLLWGAQLVRKKPGVVHPWHTDAEASGKVGRAVTVWIGLHNTNRDSSLQLLSFSHRFGDSLEHVAYQARKRPTDVTTDDVRTWALERDARSRVERFDVSDGDALLFDGKLWHYSENANLNETRAALLLQYATPDMEIRVPGKDGYDWPFRFSKDRAPCIMVGGVDRFQVNDTVPPPAPIWPCWIKTFDRTPESLEQDDWQAFKIFKGRTGCVKRMSCHMSVLREGATPHAPHSHREEELIIVVSGQADIIRVDGTASQTESAERIGPGAFVYHAADQSHSIRSVGPGPATYLVFKWKGKPGTDKADALKSSTFHIGTRNAQVRQNAFNQSQIVNGPTQYLSKLRAHVSVLQPGAGYPPHSDPYDVGIVVLRGTVETLNRQVGAGSVIFYVANELHGMKNPGRTEASYLVFEFHGN
jgi:quercetin dioxygenase-like cupin family protein